MTSANTRRRDFVDDPQNPQISELLAMSDYLQRLIRRLDRPQDMNSPPKRLTPFDPASETSGGAEDGILEINDLQFNEAGALGSPPAERGTDLRTPLADGLERTASVPPPTKASAMATPLPVKHHSAESSPTFDPIIANEGSTEESTHAFQGSPSVEPGDWEQTPPPTPTILMETAALNDSRSASADASADMAANWPRLSSPVANPGHRTTDAAPPPDIAAPKEPLSPPSPAPQIEAVGPRQPQNKGDPTRPRQKESAPDTPSAPAPPRAPGVTPTLQPEPAPAPPPLKIPQRDTPRLVIGRLQVEVVPPPAATKPLAPPAKPIGRRPSPFPARQPLRSKLRFGIGQL
jgi:hypothetical protein